MQKGYFICSMKGFDMKANSFLRFPLFLFLIVFGSASQTATKAYKATYNPGEQIEYRVHYGIFSAGEAYMRLSDKYYLVNNRPCFRSEIIGNSKGAFESIVKIRNVWGSYFDTLNFMPQKSFRSIAENKYRRREEVYFDYDNKLATIKVENKPDQSIGIIPTVQDMVSGYYFLRLQDYEDLKKNDTIKMMGIFEDKTYNFNILYLGKTEVKTKFGKTKAFVISPIMPSNNLFKGKNPIRIWISDDMNRIPLKIEAELLLGSLDMDIRAYTNLKYPIRFN